MTKLLVQSCSATKEPVDDPVPAIDLYDGYFFRIIKKALREERFQCEIDILIISAKYGVLDPDDEIRYYDQRMDAERAAELRDETVPAITERVAASEYDEIWVNMSEDYLPAISGIEEAVDVPIYYIEGSGIGMKGHQLKRLVSSDHPSPTPAHGD